MIGLADALRLKERLLELLDEDASNQEALAERLERVRTEEGIEAHAALLVALTGQAFEEEEARRHWDGIVRHRAVMGERVGRDVGLRVAAFDWFVNVNRRTRHPRLIDLTLSDPVEPGAVSDVVTGLPNERLFRMTLGNEIRRGRRYGPGFVVARIALDDYDRLVESAGAWLGATLLRETGVIVRNKVRDIDLAARVSGGEFGLVLPETDRLGGFVVCERIRKEIESVFHARLVAGRPADLTMSAGVAKYPEDGTGAEALWERAGETLYAARSRGRNTVAVFHEERRHFLRFDAHARGLQIRATSDTTLPAGEAGAGPAANISRGGLLFESRRPFGLGERVLLGLCEPDGAESIRVRGRVVRLEEIASDTDAPRYEIGVVFNFDWEHEEQDFLTCFERWSVSGPSLGSG